MANRQVCSVFLFGLILFSLCVLRTNASSAKDTDMADQEDKMGMEVLYEMVHFFLGDIIQTKNISESFLNLTKGFDDFDKDKLQDWKEWMDYGKGYAAGVVIGFLFIILMPIVGLIFCCCRLCGKCGGKPRKHDSRRSKCKRRTYCTLIIVFDTLALAGVVCSFMCSHLIYKALQNENNEGTIGHIQTSLESIKNFTDKAVDNVSQNVLDTYSKVSHDAIENINKTGSEAVDIVLKTLNATAHLNKAKYISKNVNNTKDQLDDVVNLLGILVNGSNQLKQNLTDILSTINETCNGACDGVNIPEYEDADFSSLKSMQDEANEVAKTMDMTRYVTQAEQQIEKAKTDTEGNIQNVLKDARNSIETIRSNIIKGLKDLESQKNDAMSFYKPTKNDLEDIDGHIKDGYSDYVYYGCVGVSCIYLLIVVLYYLGIVFGLCGERPGHDAPCCNRGAGASFLMAGVGFTFIFSWILMLLCTIMFVIGGISYTEVCRYFHGHDPSNFKVFDETLNSGLDLSSTLFKNSSLKFSISKSISDCQENKALYSAFHMENMVNLNDITDTTLLKDKLKDVKTTSLDIDNIVIISEDLETKLMDFSNAGLQNIDFAIYFNELNRLDKNLTKVNVFNYRKALINSAEKESHEDKKKALEVQADRLEELGEDVKNLKTKVNEMKGTLEKLKEGSKIANSTKALVDDLKRSEKAFNDKKEGLVQEKINEVADKITNQMDTSIAKLITKISTDTAHCKTLSDSIYSVSDSVCVLLVDPVNGLWFSFGWCLFFFMLCLIFGVLLAGEYRHECKYGKEFDDPLFDGRNHDMMPLTRRMHC